MTIKTKSLSFEIKANEDESGKFTAYGNTFGNVDNAGDKTMRGAFSKCIRESEAGRMPRLLSQHGHRSNPIGIITSMKEDENGLLFEGEFCTEPGTAGAEAYALVKMGALDQFSIGYNTVKSKMVAGVKELHELDVKEISLVTFACNENSLIQSVKTALDSGEDVTERMIQKALQEAGLSKRQAASAVDAIKVAGEQEESQNNSLESFKALGTEHELSLDRISCKYSGDVSLYEYARNISNSISNSVESDTKSCYVQELFMDYAIVCVYDYSDEYEHKEYHMKISYSVSNDDVMVGSGKEVTRHVQWLTKEELDAREMAGVKQNEQTELPTPTIDDETKTSLMEAIKSEDLSDWFK